MLQISDPSVTSTSEPSPAEQRHFLAWGQLVRLVDDARDLMAGRGVFALITPEERAEQLEQLGLILQTNEQLQQLVLGSETPIETVNAAAAVLRDRLTDEQIGIAGADFNEAERREVEERDEIEDRAATLDAEARQERDEQGGWPYVDQFVEGLKIAAAARNDSRGPRPAA